ncbi:MAG: hypothetical protein WD207_00150 [Xanthobacteraceae bacterium]
MNEAARKPGRILWVNVVTVISAAILIGTVIIGTGLATGWAIAGMLGVAGIGAYLIEAVFVVGAVAVVVAFVRTASRVEPFVER